MILMITEIDRVYINSLEKIFRHKVDVSYVAENRIKCPDKSNLKNGRVKTIIGNTYEEGTQLQFDCKVIVLLEIYLMKNYSR